MAFTTHMQPSASTPFGTPNHQATPTGQGHQQQRQQLFFTPRQPRTTSNSLQFPGQDPFAFSSLQSNSTPKPAAVETGGLGAGAGAGAGGQRQKRHRYSTGSYSRGSEFKPLNSSPLARSSKLDEDEDDMDDDFGSHQPSSPLGRVSFLPPPTSSSSTTTVTRSSSAFNIGIGRSTRRRPKALGRDSDDDELNPSPLVERRRAQYKSTGPSTMPRSATFTPARRFSLPPSASAMSSGSWSSSPTSSPPVAALFERPRNIDVDEDPRRAFLRERFKKRYFARATKAREKAVKARRRRVEGTEDYFANENDADSDDGIRDRRKSKGKGNAITDDEDMDDDDEEGEEEILNDELFSRIVANMNRKMQHAYRVSYAHEIGSSFDPDIEDVSRWEEELAEPVHRPFPPSSSTASFPSSISLSSPSLRNFPSSGSSTTTRPDIGSSPPRAPTEYEYDGHDEDEDDFADFEDAEIEAYAEEYARAQMEQQDLQAQHATQEQQQNNADHVLSQNNVNGSVQTGEEDLFAGLEDIPEEELFGEWNWSESEAEDPLGGGKVDEDEDMDWS